MKSLAAILILAAWLALGGVSGCGCGNGEGYFGRCTGARSKAPDDDAPPDLSPGGVGKAASPNYLVACVNDGATVRVAVFPRTDGTLQADYYAPGTEASLSATDQSSLSLILYRDSSLVFRLEVEPDPSTPGGTLHDGTVYWGAETTGVTCSVPD